ncbi:hypothetical protein CkP1_0085 [Citrobacter phage CkP1]|nr:hypothetical protein CkP1_0085 [Citrobacter phage CkP1]
MEIVIAVLCVFLYLIIGSVIVVLRGKITNTIIQIDFAWIEVVYWPAAVLFVYVPILVYKATNSVIGMLFKN